MLYELISESSDYEFKERLELRKPKSWLKTVSAFANTIGGIIFFGVDDNNKITGIDDPKSVSDQISEKLNLKIKPIPVYVLSSFTECGKTVVTVKIYPGTSTPYFYESDGTRDAYYRSGNQSIITPHHVLNELILKGTNKTYDTIPTAYQKNDYSFSFFEAAFLNTTNSRITGEDYISFGLVDEKGYLSNAGILLSDQDIYRHNRIFCTSWNGTDKVPLDEEAIDDKEYSGCIIRLLYSALDFVKANTRKKWKKGTMQRIEMPEYDELAVREAIVNAIIHREYTRTGTEISVDIYKDRLEVISPGTLFSGKKIEKEIQKIVSSERRNPVIADIFARMKFMDRRGSGLKKITERTNNLFDDNKNHVEFYSEDAFFKVVIHNANFKNEPIKLREHTNRVLQYIKLDISISQPNLANKLGISLSSVKRAIKELTELKIIVGKTKNKGGQWIIKE